MGRWPAPLIAVALVAGCIHFETTELYRSWAVGGPFRRRWPKSPRGRR
jgi:hypothetical protein